ncbi:hypothetical protein N178_00630 [Priestia aryabhattai B8W22]|nr:hypothetical protein N178_00630 [Priestia aryabhattai B8W22]
MIRYFCYIQKVSCGKLFLLLYSVILKLSILIQKNTPILQVMDDCILYIAILNIMCFFGTQKTKT